MISIIRIVLILIFLYSTDLLAKPIEITLVTGHTANPPFLIGDSDGIIEKKPGATVEALKSLEKTLNVMIKIERYPWKRCLSMIEHNQAEGIFHTAFKKERMKIGVYPMKDDQPDTSKRITRFKFVFYKIKDSSLKWDGNKLKNLNGRIGILRGSSIAGTLNKMNLEFHEDTTQQKLLRLLLRGRIAAIADLEAMTDFQLQSNPKKFHNIVKLDPPLKSNVEYLMLSKIFFDQHPKLSQDIWNEIERIRISGEFNKILQRYQN